MNTQQLTAVIEALTQPDQKHATGIVDHLIGSRVLVRTRISGVSIGVLRAAAMATKTVVLDDAVRIWSWEDAFTCSELASLGGVCRVARQPDGVVITDEGMELLPVSSAAWGRISGEWTVGKQ